PDGSPTAAGEVGEIVIQGPNVMLGYWNLPQATAAAIDEDGWFRSGDAAEVDADGFFFVRDRIKDMFISGGENGYPAEIESILLEHPAVADCAVIGVPDERWGEVGRAVIVPAPGTEPDERAVLDSLVGRVARYKIPASVEWVEELPRTTS